MKRVILNLAVAALTFSVSAGTSMIRRFAGSETTGTFSLSQQNLEKGLVKTKVEEPLTVIGGMDACGPEANFHTNDLSDGTRISNSCRRMASPAAAARALRKRLATATEVIERGPNVDENGKRVGERVVARGVGVMELETSGRIFCATEAASLKHLKWYNGR